MNTKNFRFSRRRRLCGGAVVLLAVVFVFPVARPAIASDATGANTAAAPVLPRGESEFFFNNVFTAPSLTAGYSMPAAVRDATGKLLSWNYDAGVSVLAIGAENIFYGAFAYRRTDYRFEGMGAPFGDVEQARLYFRYERAFSPRWSLVVDAAGWLAAETDARIGEGAAGFLGGGVKHSLSGDLQFHLGMMVKTYLSDGAELWPYGGFVWQIDPSWALGLTNGLSLRYDGRFFDGHATSVELKCAYESLNFRMAGATAVGSHRRAVEVQQVVLTLGVKQEFLGRAAYVRGTIGGVLYAKYKFRSCGDNVGEFRTDPAATFCVEAGFTF
ncbi:MAG: hypothetical protein LBD14_01625 [Puniceicoccales bacterium]|jgi:hypothetical protein|nr:hypothetical protein [Puniceicoccales bacterium]